MKDLVFQLLAYIVEAFLGVAVYFFAKWLHNKCEQLKEKVEDDKVKSLIDRFEKIVRLCVEATNQTFVSTLKEADNFDEAAQKEAFKKTFESIVSMLSEEDKEKIQEKFGDMSTFITTSVETYIKDSKDV